MSPAPQDGLGRDGNTASRDQSPTSDAVKSGQSHTRGPWEVRLRFGRYTTVSGAQRYPICDTGTAPLANANHRREEANARLIAVAPEMYEYIASSASNGCATAQALIAKASAS